MSDSLTNLQGTLFSLEGKVALVTGASSGLGAHFAKTLAQAGAQVIVAARRADKLTQLVDEIRAQGGIATAQSLDVTDADSVQQALDAAEQTYGVVDILVNNAGVAASKYFAKVDESDYDFVMDTNQKGAWRTAQAVAKRLLNHGKGGSIINIASILGLRVGFGESVYAMSKAAVVQMTKAMAMELTTKGIRVNAICPGYFKTEMNGDFFESDKGEAFIAKIPAKRLGELNELDGLLLLLASDASSFMTGTATPVDGGHVIGSL